MGMPTRAKALPMSVQVSSLAGEVPEVAGDGDDQDQFDPLGGLEVNAATEVDPAPRAQNLVPDRA